MKIIERAIAYSGKNNPSLSSCSFVGAIETSDGRVITTFKAAQTKGPYNDTDRTVMCISSDGGKTWSEPKEPFAPPTVDGKPTTLRLIYMLEIEKGHLFAVVNAVDATMKELTYYNEATEGLKDTYILFSHSYDGGESWEPLTRIESEKFPNMPLPLTHAPFITKEGRIGVQFEVNKTYYASEYWVHHSAVIYSSDGGYTWGDEVVITDNPTRYFWDQRIGVLNSGDVVDVFWTYDRELSDYVNIHFTRSLDGGRSFGEFLDTGLVGQPGNVLDGKDGSLLLVYINREREPEIRLAKSTDGGESWSDVLTVYTYERNTKANHSGSMNDVWAEMAAFCVGHPCMCRMSDGTVWVCFYSGPTTDRTDYHFVKIEE